MKREREIRTTEVGHEFRDFDGRHVDVVRVLEYKYVLIEAYQRLDTAFFDRTEELAAVNKATEMERSALDRSEATLKAEREAHDKTKASLSEWTSASHQLDTKRELAAAREEIEALKRISSPCDGCPHSGKGPCRECVRCSVYRDLMWTPKDSAPAPVEYACRECGAKADRRLRIGMRPDIKCTNSDCGATSGMFQKGEEPHESWIKKPEESSA